MISGPSEVEVGIGVVEIAAAGACRDGWISSSSSLERFDALKKKGGGGRGVLCYFIILE